LVSQDHQLVSRDKKVVSRDEINKYLPVQDAEFTEWKVCGKYTHGAPVKGEILAQFSANRNYNG